MKNRIWVVEAKNIESVSPSQREFSPELTRNGQSVAAYETKREALEHIEESSAHSHRATQFRVVKYVRAGEEDSRS